MANTKVGFGNYDDFEKFMRNAPDSVRRILFNAYPKYARILTDKYISSTKKLEGAVKQAASEATQKVKQATKAIGTSKATQSAKETVSNIKPSTWSKVGKAITNLKNIGAGAAAAWVMSDPRTTWNQKALAAGLLVPHPVARGASLAGLGATAIIPRAVDAFYDRKNAPLFDPEDTRGIYSDQMGFANIGQLPPQLKPLTEEEYQKAVAYNAARTHDLQNDLSMAITANQEEQNNYKAAENRLDNILNNRPPTSSLDYSANAPQFQSPSLMSSTPIGTSNQSVQNAQQGGLIPIRDTQIVNQNQPALTGNVDVLKELGGDIPDYRTWNAEVQTGLQDLYNNVNKVNQPTTQGVQSMQNTAGNEALLQYLQMQNARQQQAQQQSADILAQYQAALQADRKQNEINALANAVGSAFGEPETKAPIYYIGAKGDMRRVDLQQPNKSQPLPTNIATKSTDFLNALKVQQALTPKSKDDVTANVLTAQALGDMYGVNPLVFLNPDLAQEYMKSQGTIENTRVTGQERRKDIPLTTEGNILEERAKAADNMARDKANAYYDLVLQRYKEQGMNDRQAQYIASQEAQNVYNQQMRVYLQNLEDANAWDRLIQSGKQNLDIAKVYRGGNNQLDDTLNRMYKGSQIYQGAIGIQNPQERQAYWDFINSLNNQGGTIPTVRDNPYGTTVNQDNIIRRQRGK